MDYVRTPPFPANLSDAVIVGEVISFQPFLSSDRTTIFTELRLRVDRVYKDTLSAAKLNGAIAVPELGGTLRFKTGRVVNYFAPKTETDLEINHRYLVFATYSRATEWFGIVKLWDLTDGHARPMAPSDISDAKKGRAFYAGLDESVFLAIVQKHIVSSEPECERGWRMVKNWCTA
jgi:hypothetical protein